jgi:ubiquinone/menaquinone biosynthesis C-methylase UbiE
MAHDVCPWWLGYLLASPLRRLRHDPRAILSPHVREGMTVLEPGPGMGFFTLELARLVGPSGRVIALDVQEKMLTRLARKLERAGLGKRVERRVVGAESLGLGRRAANVDFALVFAVIHEVPDQQRFLQEIRACLKRGGRVLLSEPAHHVTGEAFNASVAVALRAGFARVSDAANRSMHSVILQKP